MTQCRRAVPTRTYVRWPSPPSWSLERTQSSHRRSHRAKVVISSSEFTPKNQFPLQNFNDPLYSNTPFSELYFQLLLQVNRTLSVVAALTGSFYWFFNFFFLFRSCLAVFVLSGWRGGKTCNFEICWIYGLPWLDSTFDLSNRVLEDSKNVYKRQSMTSYRLNTVVGACRGSLFFLPHFIGFHQSMVKHL